ncbi:MAG: DUF1836 domain-containing protein [Clostridia bacterium]|nr:DUF1836 domain-containing protein [Clostridia bacterium]
MNTQDLNRIAAYAVDDRDLRSNEIPSIDLYLDQILSLVAEKNAEASAMFEDRTLTSTMINNYSKDGLIAPIKGKKYSKEHIIQMLLIYSLKNTLSISSIRRILQGVYSEEVGFDGKKLTDGYDAFLDLKQSNRQKSLEITKSLLEENGLELEDDFDFFVFLLGLISLSADLKNIATALLFERYPDLDAVRRAELQKQKERIRAEKEAEKEAKKEAKKAKETEKDKENEK